MLFRFSLTDRNGESFSYDENLTSMLSARLNILWTFKRRPRVKSITLHRHLDNDSCGRIEFVGTFLYDGNKVVKLERKEAI